MGDLGSEPSLRGSFNSEKDFMDNQGGSQKAGLGILMQQDPTDGSIFVKSCVPGGPAGRDGRIQEGDKILIVEGITCRDLNVSQVRTLIVGTPGTPVNLRIAKGSGQEDDLMLVRGAADGVPSSATSFTSTSLSYNPLASNPVPSSLGLSGSAGTWDAEENSRLRSRNLLLEEETRSLKDELQRLRHMLDNDRNSSSRYIQEIDALQQKYSQQIKELHVSLSESDKNRRELEIQVRNSRTREEEFHHNFKQAKDQAEARETYFAEMRSRYEEERHAIEAQLSQERELRFKSDDGRQQAETTLEKVMGEIERIKESERRRREMEQEVSNRLFDCSQKMVETRTQEEKIRGLTVENHLLFEQWQNDFFSNRTLEEAQQEQYFLA